MQELISIRRTSDSSVTFQVPEQLGDLRFLELIWTTETQCVCPMIPEIRHCICNKGANLLTISREGTITVSHLTAGVVRLHFVHVFRQIRSIVKVVEISALGKFFS